MKNIVFGLKDKLTGNTVAILTQMAPMPDEIGGLAFRVLDVWFVPTVATDISECLLLEVEEGEQVVQRNAEVFTAMLEDYENA